MKKLISLAITAAMVVTLLPTAGLPAAFAATPQVLVSGDWKYTVENDRATLVAYTGEDLAARTPATIENIPVIGLLETFKGNSEIMSVIVTSGVTEIGERAFAGCDKLVFVSIPSTVRTIGESAFQDCPRLASAILPDSVTNIGEKAYLGCVSLKDVVLSADLRTIREDTFRDCTSLETIFIPAAVTSIQGSAFAGCTAMTGFEVDEENYSFLSVDSVLFNRSATVLLRYPAAKKGNNYSIQNTVTRIAAHAFDSAVNLTAVTIPCTVVTIEPGVFLDSAVELIKIDRSYQGNLVWPEIEEYTGKIIWLQKSISVIFDPVGGTTATTQILSYGDKVTMPTIPEKTGQFFVGWFNGDVMWDFANDTVGQANIILTARWTDNEPPTSPAPSATPAPPAVSPTPPGNNNQNLNQYTVVFVDGTRVLDEQTVLSGGRAIAPPVPKKTGYTFNGWNKTLTNVRQSMTVKPKWKGKTVNIKFHANKGKTTHSIENTYGKKMKLANKPVREGYKFTGWFTKKSGGKKVTKKTKVPLKNRTYYAQWKKVKG